MSESVEAIPPFVPSRETVNTSGWQSVARPTAREWVKHSRSVPLTFLTTTFAGIVIASPELPSHRAGHRRHNWLHSLRSRLLFSNRRCASVVCNCQPTSSDLRVNVFARVVGDTDGPRDGPLCCLPPLWSGGHAALLHSRAAAFPGRNIWGIHKDEVANPFTTCAV